MIETEWFGDSMAAWKMGCKDMYTYVFHFDFPFTNSTLNARSTPPVYAFLSF